MSYDRFSPSLIKRGGDGVRPTHPIPLGLLSELVLCLPYLSFSRRPTRPRKTAKPRNAHANVPACADASALNGSVIAEKSPIRTAPVPRIAANPTAMNEKTTLTHKVGFEFRLANSC